MLRVQPIESFDLPGLQPYRTMRRPIDHQRKQIFVAESDKVVRRLLETDLVVISVLLPDKWLQLLRPQLEARPEEITAYVGEKKLLETLTGFSMYQGVLAVGRTPASVSIEAVLASSPRPHLLAAVDGLSSAENLGVVVRNCVAFGVQALLVGETSGSPYLRRAVRSSMGTVFRLPIIESEGLAQTLADLRGSGIRRVAAHPHAEGKTLSQACLTGSTCLVFGSEGCGISSRVLEACDEAVAVPMANGVDSLNVGSASAVFLYEVIRQRAGMSGSALMS